jgi:hypothetical protein
LTDSTTSKAMLSATFQIRTYVKAAIVADSTARSAARPRAGGGDD